MLFWDVRRETGVLGVTTGLVIGSCSVVSLGSDKILRTVGDENTQDLQNSLPVRDNMKEKILCMCLVMESTFKQMSVSFF